jgi:hypothetical protein
MPARWERELLRLRRASVPLEAMRERAQQPPHHGPLPRPARDRGIAGIVAVAVFVAIAVFGWRALSGLGDDPAGVGDVPPPVADSPVSLWLSADRVPPGPVELVAILVDHDGVNSTFGVHATVERWDGGGWDSYGELVMCTDHWHCTARIEPPGFISGVPGIGLGPRRGVPGPVERFTTDGLEVGWYRITQVANERTVAAGIIEIAPEAPAPVPLVPVDTPAISVGPALVPARGGEVFLYPLIPPPPSGSQSREDIQAAIAGLSETARIERWDGSAWERVGRVELSPGGDSLARTALVPALPPGAYRLVREGPDAAHVGHFWVEETI